MDLPTAPVILPARPIDKPSQNPTAMPRLLPSARASSMNRSSAKAALACSVSVRSMPRSAILPSIVARYSVPNEPAAMTATAAATPAAGAATVAAVAAANVGANKPNDSNVIAHMSRGFCRYSVTASKYESVVWMRSMIASSSRVSCVPARICRCCSANSSVSPRPSDARAWKRSTPLPNREVT